MPADNLLTLLLRRRLEALAAGPNRELSSGRYRIEAGDLCALLIVATDGALRAVPDDREPADAAVRGGMRTLLGILTGRIGIAGAVLRGDAAATGKVWKLLGLLRLFRSPAP